MSLDKVIIALDFPQADEALSFLDRIEGQIDFVKIGMELFYSEGPSLLKSIKGRGLKIFLDLKMHDIPMTVTKASKVLAQHKVDMINVHAAGGIEMMRQACQAYKEVHPEGMMIAVTQLTSTSQEMLNNELGVTAQLADNVIHYAKNAQIAGLDGVVCSAWETKKIKEEINSKFLCVTPGIRLNQANIHDQKRVKSPGEALSEGSDYLVMGREITLADRPLEILREVEKDINKRI